MDWMQQMEQMTNQWMEAQKTFWSSWANGAQRNNAAQAKALWQQMLEVWQASVQQMLDAQLEGVRLWSGDEYETRKILADRADADVSQSFV
jgi:hypothetical protein